MGYLMKNNDMTVDEALTYLQGIRPIVSPNEAFITQLRGYEIQLAALKAENELKSQQFDKRNMTYSGASVTIGPCLGPSIGPSDRKSVV